MPQRDRHQDRGTLLRRLRLNLRVKDPSHMRVMRRELPGREAACATAAHVGPPVQQHLAQLSVPKHCGLHQRGGVLKVPQVPLGSIPQKHAGQREPDVVACAGHLPDHQHQRCLAQRVPCIDVCLGYQQRLHRLRQRRPICVHWRRDDAQVKQPMAICVPHTEQGGDVLALRPVCCKHARKDVRVVCLHSCDERLHQRSFLALSGFSGCTCASGCIPAHLQQPGAGAAGRGQLPGPGALLGTGLEQQLRSINVVLCAGLHQRREAPRVLRIGVSTLPQQRGHNRQAARSGPRGR
mmetsp:Transcript_27005/g.85822  ORF Transcript_27005/g.85822 Transcript_27005/m.85822 type:complete len:294 (-) Transcript_27005:1349-2230(-)